MPVNKKRLAYFERFLHPIALEILEGLDDIEVVRCSFSAPEEETWEALNRACGYHVSAGTEIRDVWRGNAALLSRCPNMLALSSTGAGYDVIDVGDCTARGVIVCNQGGSNQEAVAEHALAMMLAVSRKMSAANRALLRGDVADRFAFVGNDLLGKTVGIVGLGKIGSRTAKLCSVFDMTVLAYDPYVDAETVAARGARKVELDELLAQSDYVSVHCPRTDETIGMFGAAAFGRMKPTAYFINTARGLIHDERALLAALQTKAIAGAGLDVFDKEPPPPDHPLLQLDNVVATPHIAGASEEGVKEMAGGSARQWIEILRGRVPPRLINPAAWPRYSDRFEEVLGFRPDPLP